MLESRQRTTSDSTFYGQVDVDIASGQDSPSSNTSLDNAYCGPSFATVSAKKLIEWQPASKAYRRSGFYFRFDSSLMQK